MYIIQAYNPLGEYGVCVGPFHSLKRVDDLAKKMDELGFQGIVIDELLPISEMEAYLTNRKTKEPQPNGLGFDR